MVHRLIEKIGKDLLVNSSWLLIDKVVRLCIGLVVGVLVARYLGPEKIGLWNYGLAIFTFFSVFSSLGLESVAPRELVQRKQEQLEIVWGVWFLKGMGAILGICFSTLFVFLFKGGDTALLVIVFVLTLGYLFQSLDVVEYLMQAKLTQKKSVIVKIVAYLIIAGYKYALIISDASLLWFAASSTLEFLLVAIGYVYLFSKQNLGKGWVLPKFKFFKKLLGDSIPFAASALIILLHSRADQVIIAEILGEFQNGIYSVSIRVYELFVFIPAALTASFLPVLSAQLKEGGKPFVTTLKQLYSLLTYAALFLTGFLWFLGPWVMDFLYGSEFEGAGSVMQLLGLGLYPTFIGVATGSYIVVRNLKKLSLYRSALGLVVSLCLNFLLIPKMGVEGAAVAKVVSALATVGLLLFIPNTHQHFKLLLSAFDFASIKRFIKY